MASEPKSPRRWWHLRWLDVAGLTGLFMLIPQVVANYDTGRGGDPVLGGIGATLVLAASGGPRVLDALAARAVRRSGRVE